MPRLDERTPLDRLSGRPGAETRSGAHESATEFTPGRPHPGRWDEPSLDHLADADPEPAPTPPAWLSEPCGSVSLWHERLVPERFRGTRWDPGPRGVLVIAAIGLLAILLAGYVALREEPVTQPVPPIASLSDTVAAEPGAQAADGTAASSDEPVVPPASPVATSVAPAPPGARTALPQPGRNPVVPTGTASAGPSAPSGELVVSVVGLVEHGGLRRLLVGARVADALRAAAPRPEADLSTLNLAQLLTDGDQIIVGKAPPRSATGQVGTTLVNSAHPSPNSPPTSGTPRPTGTPAKVNLNTATEADLDTLPGIGPITAKAILTWRTRHGRFTSIDQLAEIAGIGHSRLNRLRDRVTL
ncbi:helix-hairpin-helix domain-containing protein [Nocardia sp. CDC160]|uniref:helix-hairpin-helix domain-containing protein n=1 Tax=Nocardia sp. CDC160 TaxID=3112166 RepID=UPI002DBDFE6D|nr:helix-hairpin-helix domain-containing protein [Nocardia sp. CDC160]MEC3915295.1 helix-hairpin-helix domain-containing protein [Nocardia sp. CDC160]